MPPAHEDPAVSAALAAHGFAFVALTGNCTAYRCVTMQGEEYVVSAEVIGSAPTAMTEPALWMLIGVAGERRQVAFGSVATMIEHVRAGGGL